MISIFLAAMAFAGLHLGISGSSVRSMATARLGLRGYMVVFSVISVASIVWLVSAYNAAPYVPTWGALEWWKPFQIALMLPAFVLVVAGLLTPNPTAVAQERLVDEPPQGVVRITRHPFLVGVAIWAIVHLVGNGDVASLLFFTSLGVVAIAGTVSIDAKRRRSLGEDRWQRFAARTSIIPFAAVLSGRVPFAWSELGWWRPLAGLVAYTVMLGGHAHIIGVSPFPS